jgi:acyl dehydratase
MSLDPSVVGLKTDVYELPYDWKTLVLYALGVGCGPDELDFVYEARGPKVLPTFGVVPSYPVLMEVVARSGGPLERLVHGGESVWVKGPLPPSGTLHTSGEIVGLFDLKRMAQLVYRTTSRVGSDVVFETEGSLLFLGLGGFGGPRPERAPAPKYDTKSPATFEVEQAVARSQALLYRLSGDTNPLHADPKFAALVGFSQGPILHGLASMGFCTRALAEGLVERDATRIRDIHVQFRAPVWPGETLRTVGQESVENPNVCVFQTFAGSRSEVAVAGWAVFER